MPRLTAITLLACIIAVLCGPAVVGAEGRRRLDQSVQSQPFCTCIEGLGAPACTAALDQLCQPGGPGSDAWACRTLRDARDKPKELPAQVAAGGLLKDRCFPHVSSTQQTDICSCFQVGSSSAPPQPSQQSDDDFSGISFASALSLPANPPLACLPACLPAHAAAGPALASLHPDNPGALCQQAVPMPWPAPGHVGRGRHDCLPPGGPRSAAPAAQTGAPSRPSPTRRLFR
jgi:hypothetical protein